MRPTKQTGRLLVSPDDARTAEEARIVHPLYEARLARLHALSSALGRSGSSLSDEVLDRIEAHVTAKQKRDRTGIR